MTRDDMIHALTERSVVCSDAWCDQMLREQMSLFEVTGTLSNGGV